MNICYAIIYDNKEFKLVNNYLIASIKHQNNFDVLARV